MTAFSVVVLAAGRSRRMGAAKAFLEFEGEPLLHRIVRQCLAAEAQQVIVVVGTESESTESESTESETVPNAHPSQNGAPGDSGRLVSRQRALQVLPVDRRRLRICVGCPDGSPIDSLRCGLAHVAPRQSVVLWPVDHPFGDARLVTALVDAIAGHPEKIAIPCNCNGGRHGHPIVMGANVVPELLTSLANAGARAVVRRDPTRIVLVQADDVRITADINDPAQAAALGITWLGR